MNRRGTGCREKIYIQEMEPAKGERRPAMIVARIVFVIAIKPDPHPTIGSESGTWEIREVAISRAVQVDDRDRHRHRPGGKA